MNLETITIETDLDHLHSLNDEALIELWYATKAGSSGSQNNAKWVAHCVGREIILRFILRVLDPGGQRSACQ